MKRLPRPLLLLAALLTLTVTAAGLTAIIAPIPTDAAAGPAGAGRTFAAAECRIRIDSAVNGFAATLASLSSAAKQGHVERCTAYRAHVAALTEARDVYAVCMTGFVRDDQVGQIDLATRDWRSAIAERCGG